ncbi:hypothetical protein ILUMI_25335 [Ignelater luminosus]|uniref:Major facilitator superfamily (MFS) profile domain-containing protein n=1 Tax=Ignelater luminosus TaxID=2038154 RepID=A0A8K0FZS6_IGNLU|nr:hypothetical protein ILUMI_25335 [Ignelater luminosus]
MFIAIPQMVSFILIALAEDILTFYIARFISGLGDAVFFNSLPMYVGEISEPNVRGLWGNLVAISIYFGGFIINVIGAYCDVKTTACICLVFPAIQIVSTAFLPESPYYLLMKDKTEEARASLQTLRWREDVDDELLTLTSDVKRQVSESGTFRDLFTISTNRKALLIAIGIRAAQLFSGLPAFTIYTQYMFEQAGGSISASTSAIIFTGVLTVVMSVSAFLVGNFGRRTLMIFSSTGCGVTVAIVAIYFFIYEKTNLDISSVTWIPLAGLLAIQLNVKMLVLTGCNNILQNCIPYDGKNHQWPQALAVIASSLSTLSAGSLIAWTSPSIPILTTNASHLEPITFEEASYFAVIPPFAAIIASPFWSLVVDGFGRQKTIMMMAAFYFLSWILIAFGHNLIILYVSRVLEGAADAALFTAVPIYIGEITEPSVRSSWGNLIAFFGFLGQFLINAVGSYCDIKTTALIFCVIPLIQFFLMAFMPESPYYLLIKNQDDDACTSLKILKWNDDIGSELKTLATAVKRQISESGTFKDLFSIPVNRKTLLIAIGIRATQQLSGLPAFYMYTQYMFQKAGGDFSASTSAIMFSGVFLVVITVCSFVIHRFGRKPLMTFSCLGCGIVLTIEFAYLFISEKTSIDVSEFNWVPIAAMMSYIPVCAIGLGIIPTLMLGELFSASIKGKAMCVLNICFSIFLLIVAKLFQSLSHNFGMCVPFCFFAVCCYASTFFSYYCIPETKGKTLEEIQLNLRGCKTDCKKVPEEVCKY